MRVERLFARFIQILVRDAHDLVQNDADVRLAFGDAAILVLLLLLRLLWLYLLLLFMELLLSLSGLIVEILVGKHLKWDQEDLYLAQLVSKDVEPTSNKCPF